MSSKFLGQAELFFSSDRKKLLRFVENKIADEPSRDAEDIIMDAMSGIFELSDPNIPVEKAVSYVYSAIRNRITDALRKRKLSVPIEDFEEPVSFKLFLDEQSGVDNDKKIDLLYNAIDSLKPDERVVIIATELKGVSFKDLSIQLNEPVGTLLSRKKRAMDKLRKIMKKGANNE